MSHLNWKTSNVIQKVIPQAYGTGDRDFTFHLTINRIQAEELHAVLEEVLVPGGGELRLSLPDEWTIFWKQREDDESRLLIAHPQADEWVATLSLESDHAQEFLAAIKTAFANHDKNRYVIDLAQLGAEGVVNSISNLELVIKITP